MTIAEQVKILDGKIKANKAQYDLDKEGAKVSALSSKNLEKYEYVTGEFRIQNRYNSKSKI